MPAYSYRAINAKGKEVSGVVDADTERAARAKLRGQGIFPTEVRDADAISEDLGAVQRYVELLRQRMQSVSAVQVAMFTRQFSTLLRAGLPLVAALDALIDQTEHQRFKRVLTNVRDKVNEGSTLADALSGYRGVFSDLYVNMIRAGEASGTLEIVLGRLADFLDGQRALRSKITATLAYPTVMMVVMIGIVAFLFVVVIPRITAIFDKAKADLPIYTTILMAITQIVRDYWWAGAILLAGAYYGFLRWKNTPAGHKRWDRIKLDLPLFGRINRLIAVARFSKTLSTLLASGVNMLTSLQIVQAVVGNIHMEEAVEKTRAAVTEGASLAKPLKESGMFPPVVIHMVGVGERSGQLEDMLARVAESFEQEIEMYIVSLTALLEPLMIVFMAAIVFFIMLSILLPMFQINQLV